MSVITLKIAAGIGKTRETALEVANCLGTVEIYVPTINLAEEWKAAILEHNPSKKVLVIHGRSQELTDGTHYCRNFESAEELSKAGCSVYPNLCQQSQGAERPAIRCEHYEQCHYIQQWSQAQVTIYTHAYLPLERGQLESNTPDYVIIDETFWQSCVETYPLNIDALRHPDLPKNAKILCGKLADAIQGGGHQISDVLDQSWKDQTLHPALKALSKASAIGNPEMDADAIRQKISSVLPLLKIRTMIRQLYRESMLNRVAQSVIFDAATGIITVHQRKEITRFSGRGLQRGLVPKANFLLLDASSNRLIIEQFLNITDFHEISVERNAHVTQCHSTSWPNSRLRPVSLADQSKVSDAERILQGVQKIIDDYAARYESVLVVGPSSVTGNPKTGKPAMLEAPPNVSFEHFNGLRGINTYRDYDAVIIIGRNQPPLEAIHGLARALFYDHRDPLLISDQFVDQARGYNLKNRDFGVNVQVHPDPRIQTVLEQLRERETEQALDRLRLVHHQGVPKQVLLLCNLPLDIDVDEIKTWDELVNGGSRLEQAFNRCTDGVLPLRPDHLASTFPDLWATGAAAKKDIGRKRGQLPLDISIGKMSLFKYKSASQRNWSSCLSRFDDPEIVAKTLTIALGEPITAKPAPY